MQPEREYLECSLRDCGFEEQMAKQYIQYAEKDCKTEQLRLLIGHRKKLMDNLHIAQRRVDVVDFMIRSVGPAGDRR